jgi:hypothetical protein
MLTCTLNLYITPARAFYNPTRTAILGLLIQSQPPDHLTGTYSCFSTVMFV